jgi:hypothetical protein
MRPPKKARDNQRKMGVGQPAPLPYRDEKPMEESDGIPTHKTSVCLDAEPEKRYRPAPGSWLERMFSERKPMIRDEFFHLEDIDEIEMERYIEAGLLVEAPGE